MKTAHLLLNVLIAVVTLVAPAAAQSDAIVRHESEFSPGTGTSPVM